MSSQQQQQNGQNENSIKPFKDLLMACRVGDLEKVKNLVKDLSVPINQTDEWQCSPLYLSCLCGHYEVVAYLLRNGARYEKGTLEGERCLYGSLTIKIRSLLLNYKFTKAVDENQTYLKFLLNLYEKPLETFSDVTFKISENKNIIEIKDPHIHPTCFQGILRYLYTGEIFPISTKLIDRMLFLCQYVGLTHLSGYFMQTDPYKRSNKKEFKQLQEEIKTYFEDKIMYSRKIISYDGDVELIDNAELVKLKKLSHADIFIKVENVIFPCHRAFISTRCDYFKTMFTSCFREGSAQHYVNEVDTVPPIIELHSFTPEVFLFVLEYIYTEKCNISPEFAYDVLLAADMLFLNKLLSIASTAITNQTQLTATEIYMLYDKAIDLHNENLEQWCITWFIDHIDEVLDDPIFVQIIQKSAQAIKGRQETDSIPIIDDLRYSLEKKYGARRENSRKICLKVKNSEQIIKEKEDKLEHARILERIDQILKNLNLSA
nr:258_t:CDS:2 [Entrophospora candida]CAG8630135.1 14743_t:CDS:2 [Entrophospora candida]